MDKLEMAVQLAACFPDSFINYRGEFIAHKKSNTYLCLQNCETMEDLQCKVIEWFSRAAYKTEPYHSAYANYKFHKFMLDGVNKFLGTDFTNEDMELIYTYLGNAVNHGQTVEFIRSGFDMKVLLEYAYKKEKARILAAQERVGAKAHGEG